VENRPAAFGGLRDQEREAMAISIVEVSSARLSNDKKEVVIAVRGKYTGGLELALAVECLDSLIGALIGANNALKASATSAPLPDGSAAPVAVRDAGVDPKAEQIRCELPKNCTVTDARGLVLLILNHHLENQKGYALPPHGAKQLAGQLTKTADSVLASQPQAQPSPRGKLS
jgi:hypothetical protein